MHSKAKVVSITGILSALSAILYVWPHMSIFPVPFDIFKLDFADIPALLAGTIVSPLAGLAVVFIRCSIHLMTGIDGRNFDIGILSNFLVSGSFVIVASILMQKKAKTQLKQVFKSSLAMLCSCVFCVAIAATVNYFIIYPLYIWIMGPTVEEMFVSIQNYVMAGVIPFNAIKSGVNSIIFLIIYNALVPKIRRFI